MREILFRGKRLDNGEWVKGSYVGKRDPLLGIDYHFIFRQKTGESFVTWDAIDPYTVGQFTGMYVEGKKIFEGDILQFDYTGKNKGVSGRAEVVFKYGKFCVPWGWHKELVPLDGFANTTIEIIGNIHDNPNLLKGE